MAAKLIYQIWKKSPLSYTGWLFILYSLLCFKEFIFCLFPHWTGFSPPNRLELLCKTDYTYWMGKVIFLNQPFWCRAFCAAICLIFPTSTPRIQSSLILTQQHCQCHGCFTSDKHTDLQYSLLLGVLGEGAVRDAWSVSKCRPAISLQ